MPFSSRTMHPADWSEIVHFTPVEFNYPEHMGYEFVKWLDHVREVAAVPMTITSSYRSPEYNRRVGGATDSAHCDIPCNAVDIGMRPRPQDPNWNLSRWQIIMTARDLGCRRIGSYPNGSLHLDRTEDVRPSPRMWRVVGAEQPIT
jgi:uncharacterized protein YcbK (DUF882 family)